MTSEKILTWDALPAQIAEWRAAGLRIVFTNGCFDLVHLGHVDYLEKARMLGDKMVVGINADASVRRLKGESRPLQDEYTRARVMAAMQFVDAVAIFSEDTPYNLIALVQPDILVKGNDYAPENIVGYDIVTARGGSVETIALVAGHSTSNLVQKMHQ